MRVRQTSDWDEVSNMPDVLDDLSDNITGILTSTLYALTGTSSCFCRSGRSGIRARLATVYTPLVCPHNKQSQPNSTSNSAGTP